MGVIASLDMLDFMDCRKQHIAEALVRASPCCIERGFTAHIKGLVTTPQELLDSANVHELISRSFGAAPCQNINNEDRFARHRTYDRSGHGRSSSGSAIASAHVLGEARAWHGVACERQACVFAPCTLCFHDFFSLAKLIPSSCRNTGVAAVVNVAKSWGASCMHGASILCQVLVGTQASH